MLFAHDTEVALQAAASLINTANEPQALSTVADLNAFLSVWRWSGSRRRTKAELDAVRQLRPTLRALWSADEDTVVGAVNSILREASALPQLVRHHQWDYHLHATTEDAELHVRMAVEAAMALVDVVRMKELDRLRTCGAPDCADVYLDLSKNNSRRFCTATCSNRVNAAAHRARRAPAR
jgi:predicted RNA-binding Zn ribbon-like protein